MHRDLKIRKGSPLGVLGGDVIAAIDGTPVKGIDELVDYMAENSKPGDTVTLGVVRTGGAKDKVQVTQGARPR